ncbi:hypothetical protein [Niabella ginsengisoli]|uniref:Uncharacterized protein n=1 Tax=Niabella ginsengisoli TaxID=522298 RepID=A0ABS9SLN2_9BACT|nr:hypothetical protein [Niabella ginsengisoli]MCH5599280.1 hypothetical protein [Niabella ginsengisoli]
MKLFLRLSIGFIICVLASCVKNEPFLQAYTVPPTYNFENKDSSATARLIMMHGIKNYLNKGANSQLDSAMIDSLWNNNGREFTNELISGFVYSAEQLNKMTSVDLVSATVKADSIIAFADSVVLNSPFYNNAASSGTPGTSPISQPVSTKKLFSKDGVVFDEVWFHAMLGAMAMDNALAQLTATGTTASQAWNLAFDYTGLPKNMIHLLIMRQRPCVLTGR